MDLVLKRDNNDDIWLNNFRHHIDAIKSKDGIWYHVVYKGDRNVLPDETIFISLNRILPSDQLIFDSDLNDKYIKMLRKKLPEVLHNILEQINLLGELWLPCQWMKMGNLTRRVSFMRSGLFA